MKQASLNLVLIVTLSLPFSAQTTQESATSGMSKQPAASTTIRKQAAHESPNKGYGLRFLPALWSVAAYNPYKALLFGGAALCTTGCLLYCGVRNKPLEMAKIAAATLMLSSWSWATQTPPNPYFLNLEDDQRLVATALEFPEGFLFATGGSSYQIEGCGPKNGGEDASSYTQAYRDAILTQATEAQEKKRLEELFATTFTAPGGVGLACDEWNLYAHDAELKQVMGINADRFSIERFKVETAPGGFHAPAIQHYMDKAVTLVKRGIRPIIGMHHYTDPAWFMAAGGFENSKNLDGFASYCAVVTGSIYAACMEIIGDDATKQHLIPLFYTYNSANAYAINGYQQGVRPPYVKSMSRSRTVLFNMLDAHVCAYEQMKKVAPKAKIGITINIYQLDPVNYLNPLHRTLCFAGNYLQNYSVYDFFKEFSTKNPGKTCLDWIGLNYYSHGYMDSPSGPFSSPRDPNNPDAPVKRLSDQELADSKFSSANKLYTIYADGLFLALHEINDNVAKLFTIPILITETGFGIERVDAQVDADGFDALETQQDIEKRDLFLKQYLYAASRACQVGIPLMGISIWSFMDNYEWGQYNKRYGLFGVDFTANSKTRLRRKGADYYWDAIKNHTKADRSISL